MTTLKIDNFQKPMNFPETEEKILENWDEHDIFKKSIDERFIDNPYVFYDGPPFATGLPHYGHILASTTKDVIPRYWTMKGYRVERQWGWDTHGLPIENIIEKELGLKDKKSIEDYGIEKFNEACRQAVLRYAAEWKVIIRRLGRWVDMEHDYKTMEPWYMESLWWVFKQLWQRGLIYKDYKSMHICPRCSTPLSNFEVTQGYKDIKDVTIYAKFRLTSPVGELGLQDPVYFLAWTTTPWTLPGNMLLALKPNADYVVFTVDGTDGQFIAAKSRLNAFVGEAKYTVIKEFIGSDLENLTYEPLFPYFSETQNSFRTVTADFVTLEEGTGIVHIAPAFGEDDYQVGKKEQIPLVQHVGMDGRFTKEVTDFAGDLVKPKDNPSEEDVKILKYLQERGLVFKKETVTHSYPHCWRCDTPLINYATSSWFVKVTGIKDQILGNNQKINWVPDHIKNGRFGKWLEGARDWAISRSRFWGTPLPIWQTEDGDQLCIGSIAELEQLSGTKVTDLHKHHVDRIAIVKDGKTYTRIPEVLDCWFESGAMPYASFHYPYENKEKFEKSFPAEFISEGQDQTRGWFYTLHVLSTALTVGDNPAIPVNSTISSFKNCIVNGIVLAEDGKKMSKRLNNYPDPVKVIEKYGSDALRLYLMSSTVMRSENLNFQEKAVDDIRKKVLNIIWNVFSFYKLYDDGGGELNFPENPHHVLDRWLISITAKLQESVAAAMDAYDVVEASRLLMVYVDAISTWYLRLSRNRLRDASVNSEALQTLRGALYRWTLLMAPFAPFVTELIYQNLLTAPKESVHLELLTAITGTAADPGLEKDMAKTMDIVNKGHSIRKTQNIGLKQPLACFTVHGSQPLSDILTDLIKQELNVKTICWVDPEATEVTTEFDTNLTPELVAEGKARELIRDIQSARKKTGTALDEYVTVELPDWPAAFEAEIKAKVKATQLVKGPELKIIRS